MNIKVILSNILMIAVIFIILVFLLNNSFIYNFIWSTDNLFQDLIMPVKWLECFKDGFDIFKSDACAGGTFAYGPMFLNLPINETLKIFYLNYLPYLSIFLLTTFVVISINKNTLLCKLLIFLCILNPSTILLLQRMNVDIIIFLLLIFFSFNRIFFLNWFLIFFLTFSKIYPVVSGAVLFFENKERSIKKIFLIIFAMIIVSILYLLLNFEDYLNFFNGLSANKAGYHYLFSLNAVPKIFKYSLNFNYILSLTVVYLFFFFCINKIKKRLSNENFGQINYFSFEFKLFFLGSFISLLSFIFFSNFFHREVFLIMTIPFLISLNYLMNIKYLKYFIYLIVFKYLYLFFYSYINIYDSLTHENGIRVFSDYFIFTILIKSILDFIHMSILASLTLIFLKKFVKESIKT
jgi:hypothetical protein